MFATDEEYQAALLDFFSLKEYNEREMVKKIDIVYEKIKDIPEFVTKMKATAALLNSTNMEFGLMILFSFDKYFV